MVDISHTPWKLEVRDLSAAYDTVNIITDLSFNLPHGRIVALMGKNGMGKTTLLKAILGLLPRRTGNIKLDGNEISAASPAELIGHGVAYVPQEQALFQDLSIRDNLRLALRSDRALAERSESAFRHFPFLKDRLNQNAGTLSGGEQKMLILARALMMQPKLLLIDEISEGVQPSVLFRIAEAIRKERDENGATVLLVEQSLDFALDIAEQWLVLKLGQLQESGVNDQVARDRILRHLTI